VRQGPGSGARDDVVRGVTPYRPHALARSIDRMTTPSIPTLSRPRQGRLIAGVCAGIARRLGWNTTLVRVLTVVALIFGGAPLVAYVVLWILMPNDPA
jgi:phage shock protein PspC (stress-responsive transcriptional regulator)